MSKHLVAGSILLAFITGSTSAQISAPTTRVIANRGNANPALNGFVYYYGSAPDVTNGGTQPSAITGSNIETYDIEFNGASSTGQPTVILTENVSNKLIVCSAETGSQIHEITNAAVGIGTVDPLGIAISDDGVIFVCNSDRVIGYYASDAVDAQKNLLSTDGHPINTGDCSAIHCIGNVSEGTCRLFINVGNNVLVYNITGSLPSSLIKTHVTTYVPSGATTAFSKISAIGGSAETFHVLDRGKLNFDAATLDAGTDGIAGTTDDFYVDAQSVADNQVSYPFPCVAVAALHMPEVNTGMPDVTDGIFALYDVTYTDGLQIASLGTDSEAGTLVPAANGELNDAGVAVDEDYDNDGAWDGGIAGSSGNGALVGGKNYAGVTLAKFHGEVNAWFVSAGTNGGFGRVVLPQSTVPVSLSGFSLE